MADEVEQTEPAAEAQAEAPASSSRRRWILAGGAIALLVAGGAGAGFVLLREPAQPGAEAGAAAELASEAAAAGEPAAPPGVRDGIDFNAELGIELPDVASEEKKEDEHGGEGAASPGHLGKIVPLEPFVVNIADRDRDRFLKLKTEIELSSSEVAAELEQRLPQIRDLIISLLGAKSFDEVRTIEGKNFLREEMLLRINSLLVTGKAKSIYFTEFVVQ
jgi:flagellar FliL protein